jgi:protocatechuate 3,4-dioxygenase beta subunit
VRTSIELARVVAGVVVAALVCAAPSVGAQGVKPSGVIGVVGDSLDGRPLSGAMVSVVGTAHQGTTDAHGAFRIDSVPPGTYTLALFHPLLDSIGLAVGSAPIQLPPGRYVVAKLAVPSEAGLVQALCPPAKRVAGPALVVGRVVDADREGAPVAGAKVQVSWVQTDVSKAQGIRRIATTRESTVDASGAYRVCGLPATIVGTARAVLGADATAEVPIALEGDLVKVVTFRLSQTPPVVVADSVVADSTSVRGMVGAAPAGVGHDDKATGARAATPGPALKRGTAIVSGRVSDKSGRPVSGATVSVQGADGQSVTDSSGTFRLVGQPAGTQALLIRKVGYKPTTQVVELTGRVASTISVALDVAPPTLATVNVVSKREEGLKHVGFTDRKTQGLGHFLTQEEIERKDPQIISDVFTTMPGITIDWSSGHPVITGSRTAGGGCVNYYIDDVPYTPQTPGDIDSYMKPEELAAVEVYNSVDTPAMYQQSGKTTCTTIVMWTKTKVGG